MEDENSHFVPMTEERASPSSHLEMDFNQERQTLITSENPFSNDNEEEYGGGDVTASGALRTVLRRDGSPTLSSERKRMMEYVTGENEELFKPAKTLNFTDLTMTDADETGTDIEDQRSMDMQMQYGQYLEQPNGSDMIDLALIQGGHGNQRIIEGHDSSPMDQHVAIRVVPNPPDQEQMSIPTSPGRHSRKLSVESQDISPNLYDSLDEKEDQNQNQKAPEAVVKLNLFSPLQSPRHGVTESRGSPVDHVHVLQSSLGLRKELSHSSPQSEPIFSGGVEKIVQFDSMSQSLPERINRDNYEDFKNNLSDKVEMKAPVSESEWFTPSVSVTNTVPTKPQVNHIALNIQRVKNASKVNKGNPGTAQTQSNGSCVRLNRVEMKNNGKSNMNQVRQPVSKPSGQQRPMVQGSAEQDTRPVRINPNQNQMNMQYGQNPQFEKQSQASMSSSLHHERLPQGDRYGGVGSEYKNNGGRPDQMGATGMMDRTDRHENVFYAVSSPGRERSEYPGHMQRSGFESQSLPASYVQRMPPHPRGSPQTHDREAVMTQMSQMRSPHGYSLSPQQERVKLADIGGDLQGMEDVRSHLQSMLTLSNDVIKAESGKFDHSGTASELLLDQPMGRHVKFDPSTMSGSRAQEEVSELVENFPNLSSKIFSDISSMSIARQEASVNSENQYLRDAIEKERYRRKHCEQHIQQLNSKLLEIQQQLAVAVSTDKRKDIMIEQLDKQLAKVVEGWKKREREKDDYLKMLMKEKSEIEQALNRQQAMINNFEREMANTVDELKREKEKSASAIEHLKREVDVKSRDALRAEEALEGERERAGLIRQEWQQLKETRENAESRAQILQDKLHKAEDDWYKREQELLGKIDDVKEANLKVMQMERLKMEETERRVTELEERKRELDTDNKRYELELDEVKREKESVKVEMAILEAKFESSQRKLEADLHAQMEKEISEQVAEVHEKMENMQEDLQEKHRRQVNDIHARHQKDMERQVQQCHDDARRSEENYRQKIHELEERLEEYRNENTGLKHSKQKLESQRMEILTKFQYMMQSQWNEAVSLLVSTPHRKQAVNGSFVSSLSAQMPPNPPQNPAHNLNLSVVSSGGPKTSSPNRDERPDTTDQGETTTGRVEQYINSLPVSSHNPAQQESQGFLVSDEGAHNRSFSSENSGNQVPRHPELDPTGFAYANETGQLSTYPELNLDQSVLSHIQGADFPRNIHGYLVNQAASIPSNHNPRLQDLTNQSIQNITNQSLPQNLANQSMAHSLANQSLQLQNLANQAQLYNLVSQHGAAVMLRPPQQQSHVYNQGQMQGQRGQRSHPVPPSPSKHRSRQQVQRQRMSQYEDSDEDSTPPRPVFSQPGMSPPVKQSRQNHEDGFNPRLQMADPVSESIEETARLNDDYNQISERVAEHESRQNELQHYIKMLLDRPPGAVAEQPEHDIPLGSDILETSREMTGELDLNDTAQAAQLNKELRRLQQLREQVSQTQQAERDTSTDRTRQHSTPGVMDPDQLVEISRLLDQYRHQADTAQHADDESVHQLLYLLQHLPSSSNNTSVNQQQTESKEQVNSGKQSPRGQRNKVKSSNSFQKKAPPVTLRPNSAAQSKQVLDTSQNRLEPVQNGKNQPKKIERKMAGRQQPQPKSRPSAWK